jgi:tetratricopeptide (TPR) repeat protein
MNLARVYNIEGRLDEAVAALQRAEKDYGDLPEFPHWTWDWLSGWINLQQGRFEEAEQNLRAVLTDNTPAMQKRKFDFSLDYEVINLLGQALFDTGNWHARRGGKDEAEEKWREAVEQFHATLAIDSENVTAHFNLKQLYDRLGDREKAAEHERLHLKYKPDDNAQGRAVRLARQRYPAANLAAEAVVKYQLHRPGAPGLPAEEVASSNAAGDLPKSESPNDDPLETTSLGASR